MPDDYPAGRPKYFAHKFCRLLAKATVANELGTDVCWMLTVIAHTEDAKGYSGPVLYFNGQLMSFCGLKSEDTLRRVRKKAVDAGWLHYVPGSRGVAARYWVLIPPAQRGKDDLPSDERADKYGAAEPAGLESQQPPGAAVRAEFAPGSRQVRAEFAPGSRRVRAVDVRDSSSLDLNLDLYQDPPTPPADAADGGCVIRPPRFSEVREAWNGLGDGIPACEHVAPVIHTLFSARYRSELFCRRWRDGIEAVRRSPRCHGATGWTATLKWFLTDGSLEGLLNGEFDAPAAPAGNRPGKGVIGVEDVQRMREDRDKRKAG